MRYPSVVCAVVFCASVVQAADYPTMAPQDQYMMDRAAEITFAKSAAPPSIADKATVLVLTTHGYETAVHGSNGLVCAVERSWVNAIRLPAVLESAYARAAVLQPPCGALDPAVHD